MTTSPRYLKTSADQLEIYVSALEQDDVLRSGTFNPKTPHKILETKWEEFDSTHADLGQIFQLSSGRK